MSGSFRVERGIRDLLLFEPNPSDDGVSVHPRHAPVPDTAQMGGPEPQRGDGEE